MKPDETPIVSDASSLLQWRRLGVMISLAVLAGIGLTWTLEQRLHHIPGVLDAKKTVIASDRTVRIHKISVKPGQAVVPGQPLCQLVDAQLEDQLTSKRLEVAECEAEIRRAKAIAEVEVAMRRREIQSEIFEIQLKIAGLLQEKLSKQVETIAWKDRLNSSNSLVIPTGAESDNPFHSIAVDLSKPDDRRLMAMLREDAAAASADALSTQIALCEQRLKSLETSDSDLEAKIRASSGVDVAEARLHGVQKEFVTLENQGKELAIVSSTHGTIGEIRYQTGDRVSSGGAVIEILDDDQRHVIANVPSREIFNIHTGSKVTLIFPANERRTGIVSSLPSQALTVAGQSESILPVKIEPAGKIWPKIAVGSSIRIQLH